MSDDAVFSSGYMGIGGRAHAVDDKVNRSKALCGAGPMTRPPVRIEFNPHSVVACKTCRKRVEAARAAS